MVNERPSSVRRRAEFDRIIPGGTSLPKSLEIWIVSGGEFEREGLRQVLTGRGFAVSGVHRNHLDLDLDGAIADSVTPLILINSATQKESIEICRFARDRWPTCKLVIFASNLDAQAVFEAFRAGIDGYVGKQVSVDVLEQMLKLIASGEKLIPSELFFDFPIAQNCAEPERLSMALGDANLSDREIEILQGLIRGDPNKVISRRMAIAEATVKVHVKSILRKLNAANRTQAAIWGLSRGISPLVDNGGKHLR